MDREDLSRRLLATFVVELDEQVQALNRDLLALEKGPADARRAELLRSVFRAAHSLKGAARSVNLEVIEQFCHRLEEILSPVRDGRVPLAADLLAMLFEAADALADAGERLRAERALAGAPVEKLLDRLETLELAAAPPAPTAAAAAVETVPGAAAPSADVARSFPPFASPVTSEAPATPLEAEALPDRARAATAVRVAAEKLDALLAASGELIVARHRIVSRPSELRTLQDLVRRSRADLDPLRKAVHRTGRELGAASVSALDRIGESLQRLDREIERLTGWMRADGRRIDQLSAILDEEVRRARMLPFAEACQGFDRSVRDLAHGGGKEVDLVIDGGGVELDRAIIERLRDPLRHLVRNAVDHGIESPAERRARGKSPRGRVAVRAELHGAQVEVRVADDGRGLDLDALREQARRRQLAEPADPRDLARLIFLPGLSTARMITDVSGRGVGLDVVKSQVEALHGGVEVSYEPGRGTSFVLTVPLTLTVLRALLFKAGGRTYALPSLNVAQLVRVGAETIRAVEGRDVLTIGGPPLPVVSLGAVLGLDGFAAGASGERIPVIIVTVGEQRVGFVVDEFVSEQDVMVKNLGRRIGRVRHVSGATLLPAGGIALVLSAAHLLRSALGAPAGRSLEVVPGGRLAERRKRLLVVDDSVTTRSLEKSILEGAGYEVAVAADGEAAWDLLQQRGAELVVSDVDMPRMDGIALTATIRSSERFRDLPVILLTARESEEDRARGVASGANAYLVKSAFDQRSLLEAIAQLL